MPDSKIQLLDRKHYVSLVTFRKDGSEVPTPVWFAERYGKLYAYTDGASYKVRRLKNSNKIKVAPCTVTGTVTGDWINGSARIISDPTLVRHAYDALKKKYGIQMSIATLLSSLSGRIKRRTFLELQLELGQAPAQDHL